MKIKFLIFTILLFFGLTLYLPFISIKEFQGEEGRRVLIALQMLETKEYLLPQLFGEPYFQKPPLFNWALSLFFKLTGDYSEFTARAFSALSMIISSLFLTFIWFRILKTFKNRIEFIELLLPGLIFLTTPEVIDKALRAEIDAFYTMLITFALYSWFYLHEIQKRKYLAFIISGFFLGLGILTKTFQALVFFYLAYIPYLFFQRRLREFLSFPHFLGVLTVLLVFLAWAIPISQKIGLKPFLSAWLSEYLLAAKAKEMSFLQHLESFTIQALIGFSPWIFTLLVYRKKKFKIFLKSESPLLYNLFIFSGCLFLLGYVFHFLFPGARLRYMLPSVSGLVFLVTISFYYLFSQREVSRKLKIFLFKIFPSVSILFSLIFLIYLLLSFPENSSYFYFFIFLFMFLNFRIILKKNGTFKELFIYLIFYVFLIKQLYVTFYYPFHQKEMNYFRKAALEIAELVKDKRELYLCNIIPHHLVYYLKYRYKLVNKVEYLKDCKELPKSSYILVKNITFSFEKEKIVKIYPIEIRKKQYQLLLIN